MSNIVYIKDIITSNINLHQKILGNDFLLNIIEKTAEVCINGLKEQKKLLICGNGGSAADAQHMAAEFVGRFEKERKGLAALSLNSDTSVLTAWVNDYSYDSIFRRQVESLGRPGDILIGISTSGNSKNVLQAFEYAKQNGIITVGLLGNDGGVIKSACDYAIVVPENCTARIQEAHITIIHILCGLIEKDFS